MNLLKQGLMVATLFLWLGSAQPANAAGGLDVDAKFDLTGDGIVDASDWAKMSEDVKRAYAEASVRALGQDPDAKISVRQTRAQRYLAGLRAVYE